MLNIGRLCIKTAGRDAMQHCVVVEELDKNHVLIDGNTRRKKVNKTHLEPLNKTLDIKKGADSKTIATALEKAGIELKIKGEARKAKPQIKKIEAKKETKKASKKSE